MSVVFIHGIGNQRPGDVLKGMADPVARKVALIASTTGWETTMSGVVYPEYDTGTSRFTRDQAIQLAKGNSQRTLRMVEIVWANKYKRPSGPKVLLWSLLRFPAAFLLLAPDHRDDEQKNQAAHKDEPGTLFGLGVLTRFMARITLALALLVLVVGLFTRWPFVAAVSLALLVLYAFSSKNVIGHVLMAASGGPDLRAIASEIADVLKSELERSQRLTVVGHSQGGFLAHASLRMLSRSLQKRTCLVGVGSGIKPITLLTQMNRTGVLAGTWFTLIGVVLSEIAFLWLVGPTIWPSLSETLPLLLIPGLSSMMPLATDMQEQFTLYLSNEVLALLIQIPNDIVSRFRLWMPWSVIALMLIVVLTSASRRIWAQVVQEEGTAVEPLGSSSWTEFTSYHDPVSRMLYPSLPSAKTEVLPVASSPIFDHVHYFSDSSLLPVALAGDTCKALGIASDSQWSDRRQDLLSRASRWRLLRGTILGSVALVEVAFAESQGASPLEAILDALPTFGIYWIITGLASSRYEAQVFASEVRDFSKSIAVGDAPKRHHGVVPAKLRIWPALFLGIMFGLATGASAYSRDPDAIQSAWVNLAVTMEIPILFALFVSSIAGYRVWARLLVPLTVMLWVAIVLGMSELGLPAGVAALSQMPGVGLAVWMTILSGLVLWVTRKSRVGSSPGAARIPRPIRMLLSA